MQLFDKTVEDIKSDIAANYTGGLETRAGSFFDLLISPVAYEIYRLYKSMEAIQMIVFPTEESGEYIDAHSNPFGIYRKAGTYAKAEIELIGTAGAVINAGTKFVAGEGLIYELESDVLLENGSGAGSLSAVEPGSEYNVSAGEINNLYTLVSGISSFSVGKAEGGTDPESNAELLGRYLDMLQHPSTGGNEADYRAWAMAVEGVGDADVIRRPSGVNSVKVIVADSSGAAVSESIVDNVKKYIAERRPVGADVTVVSISEVKINISATVELKNGYSMESVKKDFAEKLREYFRDIGIRGGKVSYNQISSRLLGVPGVTDHISLTVNGNTDGVTVPRGAAPVCGELTVSEVEA